MCYVFEPKVGEVFTFHAEAGEVFPLETVEGCCCDCDLKETVYCGNFDLHCLPYERIDKKHVAFKNVNQRNHPG